MNCKLKAKSLPKVMLELYKNIGKTNVKATVTKLHDVIADTATLSTYFRSNTGSNSKLSEVELQDPVAIRLDADIHKYVLKKGTVNTDYDNYLINPVYNNEEVTEGWQSVLGLVYDKVEDRNGVFAIKSEVSKAIAIATNDWLANSAEPGLPGRRSDEDIRSMLGLDKKSVVSSMLRTESEKLDSLYNHSINEIGSKAYKLLGLKALPDTNETNYSMIEAKLKTELGMLALASIENAGGLTVEVLDELKVGSEVRTGVKVIKFTGAKVEVDGKVGLNVAGQKLDKTSAAKFYEEVLNEDNKHGVYDSAEAATLRRDEIVNEGISGMLGDVVSSTHKDAVVRQSKTANYMREGYNVALRVLEESGLLRSMLGHKDETKVINITRPAVIGKNNMIEDTIKYLSEAYAEFGTKSPMFARWKVITNNRFMIDSNKLNWQDKKLHRYAVYNKAVKVTDENSGYFKLALAQSFGIDIDKLSARSLLIGDNSIITSRLEELYDSYAPDNGLEDLSYSTVTEYVNSKEFTDHLVKLVEYAKGSNKGEPEHLISGAVEFLQYNYAMAKGLEYSSQISIETDAITSGYAIKNVQFPILFDTLEETLDELEKMGIFAADSEYEGYGDRVEKGALDSYQTPANELTKELGLVKVPDSILKLIDPKGFKDNKFVGISRAFMKNPFMVLNYGSAIKSIINSVAEQAEVELYNNVNTYFEAMRDSETGSDRLLKELLEIGKVIGDNSFTERVSNQTERFELTKNEREKLRESVLAADTESGEMPTFGNVIEKVLTDQYKPLIDLTRDVNEALTAQFRVAKAALDNRILKVHEGRIALIKGDNKEISDEAASRLVPPISDKEVKVIVQSLAEVFPVLNAPLKTDSGKYSQIMIAGKQRVSGKEGDAEIRGNIASAGLRIKGVTLPIHGAMEIYKLVEAYSAGAVIPIHFFDGSVQAEVLSQYDALGVHDANYFNIDEVIEGTKAYNKSWIEMSKGYNLANEMVNSLVSTFTSAKISDEEMSTILDSLDVKYSKNVGEATVSYRNQISKVLTNLVDVEAKSEAMRKKLFTVDLYIEHAYAEGVDKNGKVTTARYKSNGSTYSEKVTSSSVIEAIQDRLGTAKREGKVLKATADYLPEVNITEESINYIDKVNAAYIKKYGIDVKLGDEFAYDPDTNTVTIIEESEAGEKAVYTAHEVKHAITYKWLKDGKNSKQFKYLVEAMEGLKDLDYKQDIDDNILKQRLEYAMSRGDEFSQVAELVAILHSEPEVRRTFMKKVPQSRVKGIQKLLDTIKTILGRLGKVDTSLVISGIDNIVEEALASQVKSTSYYRDASNKNTEVNREELFNNGKLAAYISIGKAKIEGILGNVKYKGIQLDQNKVYRTLNMVESNRRGLGYADAIMGHSIEKYGNEDMLLEVYPMDGTTSESRLVDWYGKYGFEIVRDTGTQTIMIRKGSDSVDTILNAGIIATKELDQKHNAKCKG